MNQPKDKLGQPVNVGDIIAYGHALGRCAGLRIGRILRLQEPDPNASRWAVRANWRATVIGIDDDWEQNAPKLNTRTGTLMFPNRWLVLRAADLPRTHFDLLESFVWKGAK
jgi:hypothetical protein